jgi:hypothetical protein
MSDMSDNEADAERPLLSLINDELLSANSRYLENAAATNSKVMAGLRTIQSSLTGLNVDVGNDIMEWTRVVSADIVEGTKAISKAMELATRLGTTINKIRSNTQLRTKNHERTKWLAKGTSQLYDR